MKATKLLCGIAAMALAFAACNKVDQPATDNGNFKSIAIKFDNVLTKAIDTPVANATAINVNDLQVFFSDGSNLYQAKNPNGSNATQFFAADTENGAAVAQANHTYHFLPSAVNEVLVVANLGESKTFANKTALLNYVVEVSSQQDQSNVALYGSSSDRANGGSFTQLANPGHAHPDKQVDYYTATVKLLAKVARVEVTGFTYAGSTYQTVDANGNIVTSETDHRNYVSMVVDKIAVANCGTEITLGGNAASASSTADLSTPVKLNEYISSLTNTNPDDDWMVDAPAATLAAPSFAWTVPSVGEGDAAIAKTYAYTVAPTAVPNICVALRGKVATNAEDTPLFLATSSLKKDGTALPSLEAGKVYRLNFTFDDTDLDLQGKCIDVTVSVANWEVVSVTPEF